MMSILCLIFAAFAAFTSFASASSTQADLNANFMWYCATWQNDHGTMLQPNDLYSFVTLGSDENNDIYISGWYGDATQPSNADLETYDPGDAVLTQWQYSSLSILQATKPLSVTATQRSQLVLVPDGAIVYNTDTNELNLRADGAWAVVSVA